MHRDLRGGAFDVAQVLRRELDGHRPDVLVQALKPARAGDGHNPRLLGQQPRERDLRGRGLLALRDAAEQIDQKLAQLDEKNPEGGVYVPWKAMIVVSVVLTIGLNVLFWSLR